MTILFCGGELDDFTLSGTVTHDTSTSARRTTYSRAAVMPDPTISAIHRAVASITASSTFWVSARMYQTSLMLANAIFMQFASGGNVRLRLRVTTGSTTPTFYLEKYDGTTATTLATSTGTLSTATLMRLDIAITYGASGSVKVYRDGALTLDTGTVDTTAGGSTTLDAVHLSSCNSSAYTSWSEVIVCTQDARTLSLKTLVPDAAGTTSSWTGAYTDIDETTASDTDVLTSATAMQVTSVNTTGMPSGWSNLTVTAIKCIASAARGSTGPSKLALGVRTNSTDSFPTATTLDTGFSAPVTTYYELNPVTGVAWTTTEVDALQIAFRSET